MLITILLLTGIALVILGMIIAIVDAYRDSLTVWSKIAFRIAIAGFVFLGAAWIVAVITNLVVLAVAR